jgi:3-hydroxybutyryl-CoA dehydratase
MLHAGDTYQEQIVFRQEDVETFARITGDFNPVHFDDLQEEQATPNRPIVHGMYAASSFSGVLGMVFPGKGSIALHREITFVRPVFTGEPYTLHFKVSDVNYNTCTGVIKSVLKNEKGQICIQVTSRIRNSVAFSSET